jgi:hypothetical protein
MKNNYRRVGFGMVFFSLINLNIYASEKKENYDAAIQWKKWEHNIRTSDKSIDADGRPVIVHVVFEGPSGQKFINSAFTDDSQTYTFRAAFPDFGIWRWRTVCSNRSNSELNNIRGTVEVSKYVGNNPLYKHGDLRVSEDKRHLIHADGSPFLWIGDSGWNVTLKSTMKEWKYYVDTRAMQGFSVIQINPRGTGNRITASANPHVSFKSNGKNDPSFWKDLEDKIEYANNKGIFIFVAGVGSAWRDTMALNNDNLKFEDYLTGRLAASMVIFSPSFDQQFSDQLDKIAAELKKTSSHLVTQHPHEEFIANNTFRNTTAVDFSGIQSGEHKGRIEDVYKSARQWPLDIYSTAPTKPVINIESVYDGHGNDDGTDSRAKDARKTGWIAWLSGAMGFTYGAGELPPRVPEGNGAVWNFNKDSTTYDYWVNALLWPSAGYMTKLRDFLGTIEWWNLIPAHELVRNQESADSLKMVVSKNNDYSMIVAYMPDNPMLVLDMRAFIGPYFTTWYNPKTGQYQTSEKITGGSENQVFKRPAGWEDAVLKLSKVMNIAKSTGW